MPTNTTEEPPGGSHRTFHTPGGLIIPTADWKLLVRNIDHGRHTLVTGPTGTGKTTLVIEAARHRGRGVEVFHFGGIFDAEATVTGTTQLRGGETRFVRSRFVDAVTTPGCVIVADEINRATGGAHNALMSLLDWQGRIAVDTDDGERRLVERAPGVVVLATANIGAEYVQTEPLDAALLNRMLIVRLDFPEEEEGLLRSRGLDARAAGWLVRVANEIRKVYDRGELPGTVSTRSLLEAADLVRDGFAVEAAFEAVVPIFDSPGLTKLRTIVRAVK